MFVTNVWCVSISGLPFPTTIACNEFSLLKNLRSEKRLQIVLSLSRQILYLENNYRSCRWCWHRGVGLGEPSTKVPLCTPETSNSKNQVPPTPFVPSCQGPSVTALSQHLHGSNLLRSHTYGQVLICNMLHNTAVSSHRLLCHCLSQQHYGLDLLLRLHPLPVINLQWHRWSPNTFNDMPLPFPNTIMVWIFIDYHVHGLVSICNVLHQHQWSPAATKKQFFFPTERPPSKKRISFLNWIDDYC